MMRPWIYSLSLLLLSSSAFAGGSTGGTGGANTIDHVLVEEFTVDPQTLPNIKEVEPYLKNIEQASPEFGRKLRATIHPEAEDLNGVQWYLIPKKIRELSAEKTGLHFETGQPAYQYGNEIFVSEPDKETVVGKHYLHEALMMAHPSKDEESVRKMMNYLKRRNYAPTEEELQDTLATLGYGNFHLGSETRHADKFVQEEMEKKLKRYLGEYMPLCFPKTAGQKIAAKLSGPAYASDLFHRLLAQPALENGDRFRSGMVGAVHQVFLERMLKQASNDHIAAVVALWSDYELGKPYVEWQEKYDLQSNAPLLLKKLERYRNLYANKTKSERWTTFCGHLERINQATNPAETATVPAAEQPAEKSNTDAK